MSATIRVENLNKAFTGKQTLHSLALCVQPDEMVAADWFVGFRSPHPLLACSDLRQAAAFGCSGPRTGVFDEGICRLRADIDYICRRFNRAVYISVVQNVLLGCLGCMQCWRVQRCRKAHAGDWGLAGYDDAALAYVRASMSIAELPITLEAVMASHELALKVLLGHRIASLVVPPRAMSPPNWLNMTCWVCSPVTIIRPA